MLKTSGATPQIKRVKGKRISKTASKTISFKCMSFRQNSQELILFAAKAKVLWDIVKINERIENKDEGYQRALSASRVQSIANFVDRDNVLPMSVLISFDEADLSDDGTTITVPVKPDAGWVIDGQHRLAGAHKANKDIEVPVVAFIALPLKNQINCFITINREQKGVSTSLYVELLKSLPGGMKSDSDILKERAADLAALMKVDEASPFYNRIVTTIAPRQGDISLTNFVRKIVPLIKLNGRLSTFSDDERKQIIENYYGALRHVFHKEYNRVDSIFFKTLGFGALFNVFPAFLDLTIKYHKAFRIIDAVNVFKVIDYFDWDPWHSRGSGSAAEILAGEDLRIELQNALSTSTNDESGIRLK